VFEAFHRGDISDWGTCDCVSLLFETARPKKVTVCHAIFEVNSTIGKLWDFMAQFDRKCWKNYMIYYPRASE